MNNASSTPTLQRWFEDRLGWLVMLVICVLLAGCMTSYFPQKTRRDRDIEQCTYGTVVPREIKQRDRARYIQEKAVPACLRAKGYRDHEATTKP